MNQPLHSSSAPASSTPIRYSLDLLREVFQRTLDEFAAWSQTDKVRAAVGADLLKQLREQDRRIRARLTAPFSLVVLGEFKRGKSSLINALLETPVATTNITPETVTINEVVYGPTLAAVACLDDGGSVALTTTDLAAERLIPLVKLLAQQVDHLEITAPVEWLRGVRLVDTPGTGELVNRFEERIAAYLPRADAVIYVISATSPLALTEQAFLRQVIAPQDFPKIMFVVNMLDLAENANDARRVVDSIRDKLIRLFPEAQIFGLSALDELQRLAGRRRPNPSRADDLASDFATFRARMHEMILLQRDVIQLDRASDQLYNALQTFTTRLNLLREAISADQQRLSAAISTIEDEAGTLDAHRAAALNNLRTTIAGLSDEALYWMDSFVTRLQVEAIETLPQFPLENVQKYFQFFLADVLRQGLTQCLATHEQSIGVAVRSAQQSLAADLPALTAQTLSAPRVDGLVAHVAFSDQQWSDINTAGWLVDRVMPGLGALGVGLIERGTTTQRLRQYQTQLLSNLPELRAALAEQTKKAYQTLSEQLEEALTAAATQQDEATLAALRQAQELGSAGAQRAAEATITFSEIQTELDQTLAALAALRPKLWTTVAGPPTLPA